MDQCTPDALERYYRATRAGGHAGLAPQDASEVERKITEVRQVFRENYRYLVQYARNRVDSLEGAQDIVQQAFANTLTSIERGAEIRSMSGFLHRCVHNLCINASRREPPIALDEELCLLTEKSAAASAEVRDHWREVEVVVDNLAPSQRYAFLMAEVKGCDYEEIAHSMGRSVESVRQLLSRARRIIRAKADVGPEWFGGSIPVLEADRILSPQRTGIDPGVISWIKGKLSEMQTWVGGNVQRGLETAVQSSAPVAAGVVAVAVVTVVSPPSANETMLGNAGVTANGTKAQVVSQLRSARAEVGETNFAPETIMKSRPIGVPDPDVQKGNSNHGGSDSDRDGTNDGSGDGDKSRNSHRVTAGQSGIPAGNGGGQAQTAGAAEDQPGGGDEGEPYDGGDTEYVQDPPDRPGPSAGGSSGNETNASGVVGIDEPNIGDGDGSSGAGGSEVGGGGSGIGNNGGSGVGGDEAGSGDAEDDAVSCDDGRTVEERGSSSTGSVTIGRAG